MFKDQSTGFVRHIYEKAKFLDKNDEVIAKMKLNIEKRGDWKETKLEKGDQVVGFYGKYDFDGTVGQLGFLVQIPKEKMEAMRAKEKEKNKDSAE